MDSKTEEIETKVVKQLEYYFSDYNLIKDSFLREIIIKDNGWISFETLLKFNRLKQLVDNKKDLLTDILKSIESKSNSFEINVSEEKMRRKSLKPLPQITEQLIQTLKERTVHIWGFPTDTTLDKVMFWSQKFGTIESIEMRLKKKNKDFKGCVFIVFADKSMADLMLNEPNLKFDDKELKKETKLRYYERKREFIAEKKKERTEKRAQRGPNGETIGGSGRNSSVLKLINAHKRLTKASVEKFFAKYFDENESKVRYVLKVFSKKICFVRFREQSTAADVLKKLAQNSDSNAVKVVIGKYEMEVQMLTEEEETTFWSRDKKIIRNLRFDERKEHTESREEYLKKKEAYRRSKHINRRVRKLKESPVLVETAVLHISYVYSKVLSKELMAYFRKYANVVEIFPSDKGFNVRFGAKNDAKNVLAVTKAEEETKDPLNGVLEVSGKQLNAYVLKGEAENAFWCQSIDRIEKKRIETRFDRLLKRRIRKKERRKQTEQTESEPTPSTQPNP